VRIDALSTDAAVARLLDGPRVTVHLCNSYTLALGRRDPDLRELLNSADLNLPDGTPLAWVVRRAGAKGLRAVRGPDLMRTTLIRGQAAGARHYFYGATEDVLQALSKRVAEFAPQAAIVGMHSPPFIALTSEQVSEDAEAMRAAQPDIVWIGLGTPKQDRAVAAFASELDATLVPVGAAFDFLAGTKREAPKLLRNSGLEWVFRLLTEPRRLWRRYVFGNVGFLWGVLRGGVHRLAPGATTTNG
jgi:N-acetylglucosaminyldiphosphoundecaprenol N-acetyl-beta-D-mannosaminyltransferase